MSAEEIVKDLKQLDLFKYMSDEDLSNISSKFLKRNYNRGEIVYSTETSAAHFIFVLSGKIKIFRLSELGKEQIIRLINPSEFTGELALFEGVRKSYAEALDKSVIYTIKHDDFKEILSKYPNLALKMIEELALRLHLSEQQTAWLSTSTAKERLWIYLNKEAKDVNGKNIVHYKQTNRFLAAYLGMSSETLSRVLHQLESEGRIKEYSDQYIEVISKV